MKKIILGLMILVSLSGYSQQEAMFTHYMFNTLAVNPAFAGNRNALVANALIRAQWLNFEGAPFTQTLAIHSPLKNRNIGVGFSVINEKIGIIHSTNIAGSFAYEIKVSRTAKLAFGASVGFNKLDAELTSVKTTIPGDPAFSSNITTRLLPNLGFGLFYYTERYYMGLSIPKFFENDFNSYTLKINNKLTGEQKNFYYIIGTVVPLYSKEFTLKPTAQLQISGGSMPKLDVTAIVQYDNRFWGGLMLRTGDAVGFLIGMNITEQLAVGYSFDFSYINTTTRYNGGSHEVMLQYIFNWDKQKLCPAYLK